MAFIRVCGAAELPAPGAMRVVEAGGRKLCLVGLEQGWRAMGEECPHRGAPLHEGTLEGGKVMCPLHAWAFDVQTGEAEHDSKVRVDTFAVRVREGSVEVEV